MFELCAVLGAGSDRLRRYGHLLGVLYHGCDDVADLRGLEALGGGGKEDVRDGILTLPAALAIRDPEIRELFVRDDADERRLARSFPRPTATSLARPRRCSNGSPTRPARRLGSLRSTRTSC